MTKKMPRIVDDLTRREFLVAAGLITLVPGCGNGGGNGEETSSNTRSIEHELGTAEVPLRPERVVVLEFTPIEAALSVGVEPVGAPVIGEDFPEHLGGRLSEAESVGEIEQPNLETVAALGPDMILSGSVVQAEAYDRLSEIAPTVAVEPSYPDWKGDMLLAARALGHEDAMREELSAYEERIAEFQRAMGARLEEITVSLPNFSEDGLYAYLPGSFMGQVVEEAGLRFTEAQLDLIIDGDYGDFGLSLSNEQLPLIDADAVFFTKTPEESESTYLDRLREERNPIYTRLDAVKNERVYEVSSEVWIAGRGVISANLILDDLEKHLLEGEGSR